MVLGCGGYYCDIDTCSYEIVSDANWLPDTLTDAIKFWSTKGVYLDKVEENGDIKIDIKSIDPDNVNGYYLPTTTEIFLDKERLDLNYNDLSSEALELRRKCVLAHEIGHSFGMKHVDGKNEHGLMTATDAVIYSKTDCIWNNEDQEELERIMNGGKKGY